MFHVTRKHGPHKLVMGCIVDFRDTMRDQVCNNEVIIKQYHTLNSLYSSGQKKFAFHLRGMQKYINANATKMQAVRSATERLLNESVRVYSIKANRFR